MKAPSVLEQFESYRKEVIPPDAGPVQVEESKRAFYGGAFSMLMFMLQAVGDESTSEEDGMAQLQALEQECLAYSRSVENTTQPLEQSSYSVRNPDIEARLREIAKYIDQGLPRGWGFNLLLFTFGAGGQLFYISNAQRADVLETMKEFIRKHTQ